MGKGVGTDNREVLNAVEVEIHPGNGGCQAIDLLPENVDSLPLFTFVLEVGEAFDKHTSGTAGRVVNTLVGARIQNLGHEGDNRAVGVEFLCRIAGIIGKFSDQVFIRLSHLIGRTGCQ